MEVGKKRVDKYRHEFTRVCNTHIKFLPRKATRLRWMRTARARTGGGAAFHAPAGRNRRILRARCVSVAPVV